MKIKTKLILLSSILLLSLIGVGLYGAFLSIVLTKRVKRSPRPGFRSELIS